MKKQALTEEQINNIYLENIEYIKDSNNPYVRYFFKLKDKTITIYKNSNMLIQSKETNTSEEYDSSYDYINTIGADEVGTGDTFGPIICASLYVSAKDSDILKKKGIKDSKKLNDKKILELGKYLIDNFKFKANILNNEKYNEVIKTNNMNEIKAKMHNQNISLLIKEVNYEAICLDEFVNSKKYYEYLGDNAIKGISFEKKGETKSVAVAGASIIARYLFIKEIEKMESLYNLKIPKGSSTEAQKLVNELKDNKELLNKIAKCNFKNVD